MRHFGISRSVSRPARVAGAAERKLGCPRRIVRQQERALVAYVGSFVVEDASGNHLQLYEYRGRRLFAPIRRYVLDTGEAVERVNFDTYVVAATGERLTRVGGS